MFLWWGHDLISFYNDAYRPSLGNDGKHPDILGIPAKEAWPEIWDIIKPLIDKVVDKGESIWYEDMLIPIYRNSKIEDVYWTFSYSPVLDENEGNVAGVLVTCAETTEKINAMRKVEESNQRFRLTMQQAPVAITILRGPEFIVEMANDSYLQLIDRKSEDFIGKPLFEALPEVKETVSSLLENVMNTGVPYHGNEVAVPVHRYGKQEIFYFDFLYNPLKEEDGKITGVIVTVADVSERVEARKKTEQNEQRLNVVVEASALGTWELNIKSREPQYSKRYLEIIGGYKNELKLTHEQLLKHLHPDDREIRETAFKVAYETGILHYESRLVWPDNSIHWMEARGKVFYDADNKPEKMIGTIRDITEEKLHSQKLEESEQRFRNLIMQSPVAKAILKGHEHTIEMANEALLNDIWRKNEEEVIGKKLMEVFPELLQQKYYGLLDEVYKTGKKLTQKESFISLNGNDGLKNYYIDFEYAPVVSGDNKISGIKITAIDVTEKVEARKKIEASEKQFRSLAESLPQLVWETDAKGNALYTSDRWKDYSGITPLGEAEWKAVIHPDDFEENTKIWTHSLATGELYHCDVRIKSKHGEYRWHRVIGQPVYDKENKIVKWVGAFTDIHTEKAFTQELEKQVAERTKELAESNTELAKMNKELQSFAYISSHDLQEPLRKIQTFSSQIIENELENLSEKGKDKFTRMQNAAKRMQTLIDDLLTYSRTNTQERKFEKINLIKIIDEVKDDLKEEILHKNATVIVEATCEATIIPFQFRQLLFNLISNSLKFSKTTEVPRIVINCQIDKGKNFSDKRLEKDVNYCRIQISDNGIGFEQQYSERIFEVFQRLHGKSEYQGTGIGLSIVKRIVENHHGFISAKGEI
ncbi:MAG TPA: PAS domain-containing protein, partial [Bacteroidia bacterium]|nr:PAS domain-containing protein [Bacteroidia bacterium]